MNDKLQQNKANLIEQLADIKERGALEVGFHSNIFKNPRFDSVFMFSDIIPEIVAEGFFSNEDPMKNSGVLLQARVIDKYLEDIDWYEFSYIADYFFNYRGSLR